MLSLFVPLAFYDIDTWEVTMTKGASRTGAALFLTSPQHFSDNNMGFNTSCKLTTDVTASKLEIQTVDLRMCSERNVSTSCGLALHVMEGADDKVFNTTPNNAEGWLGFRSLYNSSSSEVTLLLESTKEPGHNFSVWLYVRPESGTPLYPSPGSATDKGKAPNFELGSPDKQSDDILRKLLLYGKLGVSGVYTLILIVVFMTIFSCYKWRVKRRRYMKKQAEKTQQKQAPANQHKQAQKTQQVKQAQENQLKQAQKNQRVATPKTGRKPENLKPHAARPTPNHYTPVPISPVTGNHYTPVPVHVPNPAYGEPCQHDALSTNQVHTDNLRRPHARQPWPRPLSRPTSQGDGRNGTSSVGGQRLSRGHI
ncbi:hypothetical protein BaRGS_00024727 [Batillaria attramentaria]|uniref:CUB domain-containing protein n=1 Tax=Batillaria attramentaria TaxID=370345 RepID=A0ABD0KAD8_9CAEN